MSHREAQPATTQFSHHVQRTGAEAVEVWRHLRDVGTVSWSTEHGGYHVVSGYAEICEAARQPEIFSSVDGPIPALPFRLLPVHSDPPVHREYRRVLNPWFTPQHVAELEPLVRGIADELLRDLEQRPEFEFCSGFAIPFPQRVALAIIGVPAEERDTISTWVEEMVRLRLTSPEKVASAGRTLAQRIQQLIAELRSTSHRDAGMISALVDADIGGRFMTDEELVSIITLLLFGGLDTTTSALAGAMHHLVLNPLAWKMLQSHPELLGPAAEEFVRFTSPVQGNARTAVQDTNLGGCPIKAGDRVFLVWGSGNRDEAAFDDADSVVFERPFNRHLGFGHGPHRCVGAHLGKLMLEVALEEILRRLDGVRVLDESAVKWVGGETHGIRVLPLLRPRSDQSHVEYLR